MSTDRIKTALEIALEKAKNINFSDEELKESEYFETGKKLAGKFVAEKNLNLQEALKAYSKKEIDQIRKGLEFILMANVSFPKNESDIKDMRRVMEGVVSLKKNKQAAAQLCAGLEEHFKNYLEQKKQIYNQLKNNYLAQMKQAQEDMEKKTGTKVRIDVEKIPEFQKEWNQILLQIEQEYSGVLDGAKEELKALP